MLSMALVTAGCGSGKGPNKNDDNPPISGAVTPDVSGTPTPEVTPDITPTLTPTSEPKNLNPFGIIGHEVNAAQLKLDEAENVQLLASIAANPKIGDKFIFDLSILSYNNKHILVEYVEAKTEQDYQMAENCKHHLLLLDANTLKVVKEVVLDGYFFINTNKSSMSYEVFNDPGWTIVTYDYELNLIAELKAPGESLAHATADGKRCYYIADKKIYVLNGENNVAKEIAGNGSYLADYISGVITDDVGTDFVIFSGMAADYKDYQFILDASTGEILRVFKVEKGYSEITRNTYTETYISKFYPTKWLMGSSKDKAFDFEWKGADVDVSPYTMSNGDKLFKYAKDSKMYLFLFDYKTGTLKGSTSFDVSELEGLDPSNEFMDEDSVDVKAYICDNPTYMSEDAVLLTMGNYASERFFVKWNLAQTEDDAKNMIVTEHKMGTLPFVDVSKLNNPLYSPGKLRDSLKPLRTKADKLEEKYGVEILIGEECSNILGGYTVAPLTEYRAVENALEILDEEMEKYPDNFFEQFDYSWIEGLDIYLASTLKGINEDVLDYAGGFKTIQDSRIVLVLDCNDLAVESIFHHELCHAIEEKIVDASYSQENPMFHNDKWNSFNPFADMYTYTYAEYGFSKYQKYTYDRDIDASYFIDAYAMTYPSEDRARLFESVMSNELFDIDFEEAPNLKKKLNFYAKCIRQVFDTTGWEDVPWEEYLN